MLHVYKGQNNVLIFTGLELATIVNPYYLFIFTSANEDIVKLVGTNISTDARYQKINVLNSVFNTKESGTWRYEVREQISSSNLDPVLSGAKVEEGYMYLHNSTTIEPIEYDLQDNEFKAYNGETI
jgi:hypothetical protein